MSRVVVAMSGGVDSSVAAMLLVRQGYQVIGATMQIWPEAASDVEEEHGGCCSLAAVHDARRVCDRLCIPHYVLNLRQDFEDNVIKHFCTQYEQGRTPNPCIVCNRMVKFDGLLHRALALKADYLATGHYARIEQRGDRWLLKTAAEPDKDQSYALYSLTQFQLRHTLFPVGGLAKTEVRALAKEASLPVYQKPESQDICFVVKGAYTDFLRERGVRAFAPGPILDRKGTILGKHSGIGGFTVGQRKGLGIPSDKPLYVLEIRPEDSAVVVGSWEESLASGLVARDCNWICWDSLKEPVAAEVKIRYRSLPVRCTLSPLQGGDVSVTFDSPQRAVTPGQAAVFYQGEIVLGGGTIEGPIW